MVPYLFTAYALVVSFTFLFALYQTSRVLTCVGRNQAVSASAAGALQQLKFAAVAIAVLMLAGIAGLMLLAAGKGEDITGIVAPALLVAVISSVGAVVAGVWRKRVQRALVSARS